MQPIPLSMVDQAVSSGVTSLNIDGKAVFVSPTPAGRNSQPNGNPPTCAGNTNCLPICRVQAKWDGAVTLNKALNTRKQTVIYQPGADHVLVGPDGTSIGIAYSTWHNENE